MKAPITILFNDSHSNHPSSKHIPQGGPSRFADLFTKYFKDTDHTLVSVFFSHNPQSKDVVYKKILSKKKHAYTEIQYPREKLTSMYGQQFTKKDFLTRLNPWMEQVEKLFEETQPDVLFLNGYGLTNYLLFAEAKKRSIPVCIQHAGLWKKEVTLGSGSAFSPSVAKIFSSLEKDLTTHMTHHIFLNTFSKEQFLSLHNLTEQDLHASSIIPLPIPEPKKVLPFTLIPKSPTTIAVGTVARWDIIKNHSALLRLAEYAKENSISETISAVTEPFNGVVSGFRARYTESVTIVPSMSPEKLSSFYLKNDVIILPSLFDVSPTVLMEATLLGKPVIISNQVGWVSAYKSLGLLPLVISPNDSGKEIQHVIDILFKHPEKFLKRLGTLQKRILAQHLPQYIFPKYEKLFITLSKNHG